MTERDPRCWVDSPERATVRLALAVLLFHRGGPWTTADRDAWFTLTGSDEATTVTLCDLARSILKLTATAIPDKMSEGSEDTDDDLALSPRDR